MPLPIQELVTRALRVKLVLSDCDGVLTDAGVYYSEQGEMLKRFSLRDGMGVEILRNQNIETGFITREDSRILEQRAKKLKLRHVYVNVFDKRAKLDEIIKDTGIAVREMAYIGDDINDLGIMQRIREEGLVATPFDGVDAIQAIAHYRTSVPGGQGAFRDFAQWILNLRN